MLKLITYAFYTLSHTWLLQWCQSPE